MLKIAGNSLEKETSKTLKKIYKKTLRLEDQKPRKIDVFLEFTNNDEMKKLNNKTRKINKTTDVLSFPNLKDVFNNSINKKTYPLDVDPETKKVFLGDIVININRAKEQAGDYGHSLDREICYLFVHGLLHLLGYDHEDEMDKNLMRGQEELILSNFKLKRS